jgi:hypothetical protein
MILAPLFKENGRSRTQRGGGKMGTKSVTFRGPGVLYTTWLAEDPDGSHLDMFDHKTRKGGRSAWRI